MTHSQSTMDKTIPTPWYSQYDEGVPNQTDITQYNSLVELLDQACSEHSERSAFSNMGTSLSYSQLEQDSQALAAWLQNEVQLKKGDRVAIMMPNLMQYPIALYAILRCGAVAVNVNPLYTPRELKHQLQDSGARAIIILENFAHTLQSVLEDNDPPALDCVLTTRIGDCFPPLKSWLITNIVRYIKKGVPSWSIDNTKDWSSALKKGKSQSFTATPLHLDDLAFLQYTGGTTGVSKGAMLSHANMVANVLQVEAWIKPAMVPHSNIVTPLPLYHIFSLTVNCLLFMKTGGNNILITNPRDMPAFIKTLKNTNIHAMSGVNTLYNGLLNQAAFREVDFSHASLIVGGGMAVQKDVANRWQEATGTNIREGYGLTETSPVLCINPMHKNEFTGAVGLPICNTEIAIMNDEGNCVPIGETGEICARGPQIMQGYWQRPEATQENFHSDGWFRTGDIGYLNEEGYLFIADRKKDMVLVSGFNVYPNEVENVLTQHPDIIEAAVIGIPHEQSGEIVKAFIVRANDTLTKEAILIHCRHSLTAYKVPKAIEFRDELPKTNVGKVLRRALRDE